MSASLHVENASGCTAVPDEQQFARWAAACLDGEPTPCELAIRIVNETEGAALNLQYRQRDYATNVLSFPMHAELEDGGTLLGDLAICAAVVQREAQEQGKSPDAHWAHMTIHGTLHLLGYDHEQDSDADIMEQRERQILAELGFPDPYQ